MKKNDDKSNKLRKAIYDDKHEKRNAKLQKIVVEEKDRMQKVREKIGKYYQEIKHFKKTKQEKEKMIQAMYKERNARVWIEQTNLKYKAD